MLFGINTQGIWSASVLALTPLFFSLVAAANLANSGFKLMVSPSSKCFWSSLSSISISTSCHILTKFTYTEFETKCVISSLRLLHDYPDDDSFLCPGIWVSLHDCCVRVENLVHVEDNLKFFLTYHWPGISGIRCTTRHLRLSSCAFAETGSYCLVPKFMAKTILYVWKRVTKSRNLHCWRKSKKSMTKWVSFASTVHSLSAFRSKGQVLEWTRSKSVFDTPS